MVLISICYFYEGAPGKGKAVANSTVLQEPAESGEAMTVTSVIEAGESPIDEIPNASGGPMTVTNVTEESTHKRRKQRRDHPSRLQTDPNTKPSVQAQNSEAAEALAPMLGDSEVEKGPSQPTSDGGRIAEDNVPTTPAESSVKGNGEAVEVSPSSNPVVEFTPNGRASSPSQDVGALNGLEDKFTSVCRISENKVSTTAAESSIKRNAEAAKTSPPSSSDPAVEYTPDGQASNPYVESPNGLQDKFTPVDRITGNVPTAPAQPPAKARDPVELTPNDQASNPCVGALKKSSTAMQDVIADERPFQAVSNALASSGTFVPYLPPDFTLELAFEVLEKLKCLITFPPGDRDWLLGGGNPRVSVLVSDIFELIRGLTVALRRGRPDFQDRERVSFIVDRIKIWLRACDWLLGAISTAIGAFRDESSRNRVLRGFMDKEEKLWERGKMIIDHAGRFPMVIMQRIERRTRGPEFEVSHPSVSLGQVMRDSPQELDRAVGIWVRDVARKY
ncbi:hypothetical protein FQN54_004240 [Arachnomyces sp. PD_36]|nr:hypothetical protein FQN54_004240 [Arachnomyces sp. PD_36]